ncbi:MAG: type IX secretion system membrane protein PorP/SprF, partial [Crocinitomicaceae bacterium]
MSNPSFSNIDLWLFELAEGNLSPTQIEQLELFLLQHPEFDVDRDVWEMARINAAAPVFEEKEQMRRRVPVLWYSFAGTAALFFLSAIALQFFNYTSETRIEPQLAEVNTQKINNQIAKALVQLKQRSSNDSQRIVESSVEAKANSISVSQSGIDVNSTNVRQIASDVDNTFTDQSIKNTRKLNPKTTWSKVGALPLISMNLVDNATSNSISPYYERSVFNEELDTTEVSLTENEKRSYGMGYGDYEMTLKGRWNKFSRNIQRMMDNPVALKNYRDPHYHVPGMLPNDVNFSSTGALLTTRVQAISRLQWQNAENEQLLSQIAIDGYAYGMRGGVGVQINHGMYNDGAMNLASVALTYSPKISISKTISFEPAVRFKMGNKSFDKKRMSSVERVELDRGNVHDFYPEDETPIGNDLWYKDLGLGMMVNTEWFFIGAQVDNIFRYRDNIYSSDLSNPRRAS